MTCGRCGSLMVVESVHAEGSVLFGKPRAARCLNCGNIEDDRLETSIAVRSCTPRRKRLGLAFRKSTTLQWTDFHSADDQTYTPNRILFGHEPLRR